MGENHKVNTEGEDAGDNCPTHPMAEECASVCNSVDSPTEPIAMQGARAEGGNGDAVAQVGDADRGIKKSPPTPVRRHWHRGNITSVSTSLKAPRKEKR